MIAFLRGVLFECHPESITVEVDGMGFEVLIHSRAFAALPVKGSEIFIYTYFQVLENEFKLYGFLEKSELELFKILLGVSGIGAKAALGILGSIEPDQFYQIIAGQDIKSLTRIPGIGKKTAERLIFELKDKIDRPVVLLEKNNSSDSMLGDILEALETLGYNRREIVGDLMDMKAKGQLSENVEENIKKVLRIKAMQFKK